MSNRLNRAGLQVDADLAEFVDSEVLAPLDREAEQFWQGFAKILDGFVPRNRELLEKRHALQSKIDDWHRVRQSEPIDQKEYQSFLAEIGYLVPEPDDFSIDVSNVDAEIATLAGPQLVVPITNARFVLNAANARWGSLYDALYGTDALGQAARSETAYDKEHGEKVILYVRRFLDETLPQWQQAILGEEHPALIARIDEGLLFRHNGIHIEIKIDHDHPIGKSDPLGVADVILESALTTICDLEDSVATVDAEDKLHAYRNWLGLMRGDLETSFTKNGKTVSRSLAQDKRWEERVLPGRSLLFVRNVGHLMTNPAILLPDGGEVPEGIMDTVISSAIGAHDLAGLGRFRNSKEGSIYIVKPKMHGPDECAFTNELFEAVEDLLELDRFTIKVGVMDEERRTSANLSACIEAVKNRIVFINTGFLDRTGDEIHTSKLAGPVVRKAEMKETTWLSAYEARNVAIGLKHGFSGKAQIGKGMWAAPDEMAQMLEQKVGHPHSGANTAWVPSPTAATLHAAHYHQVDVFKRQSAIVSETVPGLSQLLSLPLQVGRPYSVAEIAEEVDDNVQSLLGYVVRWVDQGVGCSKVPDINDVGLMEDRATLRISSQLLANWLAHEIITPEQIDDAIRRMAKRVDAQNANDPAYQAMAESPSQSIVINAARELILEGAKQPSGYTEPILHKWRLATKSCQVSERSSSDANARQ